MYISSFDAFVFSLSWSTFRSFDAFSFRQLNTSCFLYGAEITSTKQRQNIHKFGVCLSQRALLVSLVEKDVLASNTATWYNHNWRRVSLKQNKWKNKKEKPFHEFCTHGLNVKLWDSKMWQLYFISQWQDMPGCVHRVIRNHLLSSVWTGITSWAENKIKYK